MVIPPSSFTPLLEDIRSSTCERNNPLSVLLFHKAIRLRIVPYLTYTRTSFSHFVLLCLLNENLYFTHSTSARSDVRMKHMNALHVGFSMIYSYELILLPVERPIWWFYPHRKVPFVSAMQCFAITMNINNDIFLIALS